MRTAAQALVRWGVAAKPEQQEKPAALEPGESAAGESSQQYRGRADAMALWVREHDPEIGVPLQGTDMGHTLQLLERARTMAMRPQVLKGVESNLATFWDLRCQQAIDSGDHQTQMNYWLASQMLKDAAGFALGAKGLDLTARHGQGSDDLWGLRDEMQAALAHQKEFASVAAELVRRSGLFPDSSEEGEENEEETPTGEHEDSGQAQDHELAEEETGDEDSHNTTEQLAPQEGEELVDLDLEDDEFADAPPSPRELVEQTANREYRVFTTEFDKIVRPRDLAGAQELADFSRQLEKELKRHQGTSGKLARRLRAQLIARQMRYWEFDAEEGALDPSRLVRLVTDPMQHSIYKNECEQEERDTAVTLLIDSSGSMRGRSMMLATACAYLVAETLEMCGVTVEVLGFTTMEWKGGRTAQAWKDRGSPPAPGRLNDLCHIILKGWNQPWNAVRRSFSVLLKGSLLKENIDGEALLWAHRRLLEIPCNRRILLVISDGAPVDERTMSVNGPNLLDIHLNAVTSAIQEKSPVELLAIGIGHDVSRYYEHSCSVMSAETLVGVLIGELVGLFSNAKSTGKGAGKSDNTHRSRTSRRVA